jgi:hypothetical protein
MMLFLLLALALEPGDLRPREAQEPASETVIIECPGLRCAACQLGVLRGPKGFPGVRSVEFDAQRARLILQVEPGFDRHAELLLRIQHVAEPVEMFRATLVRPLQFFLYIDTPLDPERGAELTRALKEIPHVRSVSLDPREVFSIIMDDTADQTRILSCVRSFGVRGELFGTRHAANVDSRISELSHHVIGLLVILLGFLILVEKTGHVPAWWFRWGIPGIWMVGGLLVIVLGDLDSWPFQRSLADSLTDKLIFQHKVLGVGMILLAVAEARQRRNKGWRYGPVILFLAVASLSGVMLQYHFPDMVDPGHLELWQMVNRQHLVAAVVGGLALAARALHDFRIIGSPRFGYVWPILLGLEGALLCVFSEPVW